MCDQIITCIVDGFAWFFLARSLTLDLDSILEGVWLSIPGEFYTFVSQKLMTDNIAQTVIFIKNRNDWQIDFFLVYGDFGAIKVIAENFDHFIQ